VNCFSETVQGRDCLGGLQQLPGGDPSPPGPGWVRIKRVANPGPYAEQLPRVLGHVFLQTAWRLYGGGQPQQEKAAREQQMAASEQELKTGEETATPAEPKAADPQTGAGKLADRRGQQLEETKTALDRSLYRAEAQGGE
jgi:hypothetical protein